MADSISDRVFALVAEERGEKREKLQLTTTLSDDLGIDGDDAVEFFEKFGREFSVDLRDLNPDWSFYFAPEGVPPHALLLWLAPGLAFALLLIYFIPRLPDFLASIVAFVSWFWILAHWTKRNKGKTPRITIEDLIQTASAGKWVKTLPQEYVAQMARPKFYDRFINP